MSRSDCQVLVVASSACFVLAPVEALSCELMVLGGALKGPITYLEGECFSEADLMGGYTYAVRRKTHPNLSPQNLVHKFN